MTVLARYSVKVALASIFVVLGFVVSTNAQPMSCPPPGVYVAGSSFLVPNGSGGCCEVIVEYCYTPGATQFTVNYGSVTIVGDLCQTIMGPGLFNWLTKKIAFRHASALIPICPTASTITIKDNKSSCYRIESVFPNGNGGNNTRYNPCGESTCSRVCSVCFSNSEMDPCNTNEPMLNYLGCQNVYVPCVPAGHGNECIINTCSSD